MKFFKKYILPFLILYVAFALVIAGGIFCMSTRGMAPIVLSEIQFVLVFVMSTIVAGLLTWAVMSRNKNIKAIYANISKQPLLVVCVGEGLYTANALMANLFDGLVLGSFIVLFPLLLYVIKATRDINEMLS